MKYYTICLLLLIFDINYNNGHTLSRTELSNTDVYEVKEEKSSLAFTHPRDERPTLREIIYYHIIERPYDEKEVTDVNSKPKISKVETRNFTNGHGFQFLGHDENNSIEDDDDDTKQIETDNEGDNTTESDDEDDVATNTSPAENLEVDKNDETTPEIDESKELDESKEQKIGKTDKPKADINDKKTDTAKQSIADVNPVEINIRFSDFIKNLTDEENLNTKKKPASRRRRDIDYSNLPDAPSLPEFKLDVLPDYIKAVLQEPVENGETNKAKQVEELEEEIEKQVGTLEKAVDKETGGTDGREQKREVKTYGMSLAGDSGIVWNDLNTAHVSYHVGESKDDVTTFKPEVSETTIEGTTAGTTEDTLVGEEDDRGNNTAADKNQNGTDKLDDENKASEDAIALIKEIKESFNEIDKILDELQNDTTKLDDTDSRIEDTEINKTTEPSIINKASSTQKPTEDKPTYDPNNKDHKDSDDASTLIKEIQKSFDEINKIFHEVLDDTTTKPDVTVTESTKVTDKNRPTEPSIINKASSTQKPTENNKTHDPNNKDQKDSEDVSTLIKEIQQYFDEMNKILHELLNDTTAKPDVTDVTESTKVTDKKKPTEPSINNASSTQNSTEDKLTHDPNNKDEKDASTLIKEIQQSFDEIEKIFKELINNTTIKPDVIGVTESSKDKSSTPVPDKKEPSHDTDDKSGETSNSENESNRKDKSKDSDESKQQQFVKELMKNKNFWQWLNDSSTTYLEIMMKKVDALIKAEVEKQIEQYFKAYKSDFGNCKPDDGNKDQNTTLKDPVKPSNDVDVNNNATETAIVSSPEHKDIASNETIVNKPINTASETESETLAKKHKDKESDDNKKDTPVKIEAQNVYGSSVGNGKVTNIFIFNIGNNSDVVNVKPLTNGTNGVFVFGLDDQKKEDTAKKPDDNKINKTENLDASTIKPDVSNEQINKDKENSNVKISTAKPEAVGSKDEAKDDNQESTTETIETVTEKTTVKPTGNDATTEKPNEDSVTSTEKAIEHTTEPAKESTTESKDSEFTTELSKDIKPATEKPDTTENPKEIENNSPKPNDNEKPVDLSNSGKDDGNKSDGVTTEMADTEVKTTTENTKEDKATSIDDTTTEKAGTEKN